MKKALAILATVATVGATTIRRRVPSRPASPAPTGLIITGQATVITVPAITGITGRRPITARALTPITAGRTTGIATGAIGNRQSPERRSGLFADGTRTLCPERGAVKAAPGIAERGGVIFLALAFEFLLRGLEARDACCDFLALTREPVFLFVHRPSFF